MNIRLRPAGAQDAGLLAALRRAHAAELDPCSTLERLPSIEGLAAALGGELPALVADGDDGPRGYGLVRGWVEGDGTRVRLLDVWVVPGDRRAETEADLFRALEAELRGPDHDRPDRSVLGANSRDTEPDRTDLLLRLGYAPTFEMVELELTARPDRSGVPAGIALRPARPADAAAVARLVDRVWAGRPYFTPPGADEVERWLTETDPGLYLLAVADTGVVGLASAVIDAGRAEIDDLGVDPAFRGRGLGAALVTELLDRLRRRGAAPVRLHTEGHDPAGALRLYRRLGFTIVGRSHRFRKPEAG